MHKAGLSIFAALFVALLLPQTLRAETQMLGFGRLFSNDALGDTKDRWRTATYAMSLIRGEAWEGRAPERIGALLEYRLRSEIIAPQNLAQPSPLDRRYVGALSFGVHSYFTRADTEFRVGLDLVAMGPQTGVGRMQRSLHKLLGAAQPGRLDLQLPNRIYPTISGEIARSYPIGTARLRAFVEAQAGVETYARIGGDLVWGNFGQGALLLRDQTTGQRYHGVRGDAAPGISLTLGGDIAQVASSAYLPKGGAVTATKTRSRLRAGVNWRGQSSEVFYGVTYLGKEFKSQPTGQTVGSLQLRLRF